MLIRYRLSGLNGTPESDFRSVEDPLSHDVSLGVNIADQVEAGHSNSDAVATNPRRCSMRITPEILESISGDELRNKFSRLGRPGTA